MGMNLTEHIDLLKWNRNKPTRLSLAIDNTEK